ncbi:MAG: tRNA lysidine(34) synthetase TilS [Clostridia bacterium]|nr:tRNA lysidine(34) synthetase TilS [Clostridia bacterium]
MNTLLQVVKDTIKEQTMLSWGDRVLVALSGGADSVALLKALSLLQEEMNLTLTAAHVNHGIRGEEANEDERLAKELCEDLHIPFLVYRVDLPAICQETGEGVEECGRRVRYEFFRSVENIDKIATAHTRNDNAETLLLHLVRGAGLQGLRGILPIRGNIVRPLIDCTREQVETFCKEHSLDFAKDSTNEDIRYRRNFIRHKISPLLQQLNPSFLESMGRCTAANQKDFDYLRLVGEQLLQEAKNQQGYRVSVLNQAHPVPLHYALQTLFLQENIVEPSAIHWQSMEALLKKGEGKCSLPGDKTACVFQGILYLDDNRPIYETPPVSLSPEREEYEYMGRIIKIQKKAIAVPETSQKVCNLLTYKGPDSDKIGKCLQLRTRREGDRITLSQRGCTKSLKKLFNELKLPHKEREKRLVLCDEQGILWVEGVGCDARCSPGDTTKYQLIITIQ